MNSGRFNHACLGTRSNGFTLIELMIAIVLGVVVVGATIGIFLSNRQVYRATESLGRIQESVNIGFELMARDLREAGGNPCDIGLHVANVVNAASSNWWSDWSQPLRGYDNGALEDSLAGSDAIQVLSVGNRIVDVVSHAGTTFTVASHPFAANDVLMVCDTTQLAIFRVSSISSTQIEHASSAGNCSDSLNILPAPCASGAPAYHYPLNSQIGSLKAVRWYVAENGRGGSSLYRLVFGSGGGQEIVEGVTDMQLTYLHPDSNASDYIAAGSVGDWSEVLAVRIALTMQSIENTGTDGAPISRELQHVVNLRSRAL